MNDIYNNWELIAATMLITWAVSMNDYLEAILNGLHDKYNNYLTGLIYDVLTCWKCLTLWTGFAACYLYDMTIITALVMSFLAWIILKISEK